MNQNSRTTNVVRNVIGGVGGQIFASILQFVCRTFFIKLLSQSYLGVNGLFSTILSMLSLAELGIGPAIVFSMYKPIAENDELHVAKLMNFYKTAYRIIGLTVALIGLSFTPFLSFFIQDPGDVENIKLIFLLTVTNTAISYFMAYKGAMLNADQKAYVTVIIRNIFAVVQNIGQIIVLVLTHNYILYIVVNMCTTLLANFVQMIYVNKKYPFLVKYKDEKVDKAEKKDIFRKVRGMFMHKFGGFVLNGTDNMLLSRFAGLVSVGIYSNYNMIITMIKGYMMTVASSITASVGNLIASENREKVYEVYKTVLFMHFWMYAVVFSCFWVIFSDFIILWIGKSYLIDNFTLFMVLMIFYLYGVHNANDAFTNASGIFYDVRWKPFFECVANLGISIILAKKIGMPGVFVGSVAAYVLTGWIEPWFLFRKIFKVKSINYFIRSFAYLAVTVAIAFSIRYLSNFMMTENRFLNVVIRTASAVVLSNIFIILLFFKTREFKGCLGYAGRIVKKVVKRRK